MNTTAAPTAKDEPRDQFVIGRLPAVDVNAGDVLPTGPGFLISKAWVHEGAIIALYGTNDKLIGWIDTHTWTNGHVYRDQILPDRLIAAAPGFPVTAENGLGHIADGMTLRDWFAAHADISSLDFGDEKTAAKATGISYALGENPTPHELVLFSARVNAALRYALADAMIAQRSKGGE
ncbi:hypothetical protein LB542_19905 [Mesorhizobium sp. BR1-1-9]|uniref:hypothetical protein n=1 Tax=Mesorhizobium sp. BR1-1-9 TaxID=2876646 RepID=UPI001CD05CDE|nr:hypothetical protein [Mesorhizobium sp. BR1-1-9]MBZ9873116.1 hypothetical protein [Mesorhizobium sp. BR1-1-9]